MISKQSASEAQGIKKRLYYVSICIYLEGLCAYSRFTYGLMSNYCYLKTECISLHHQKPILPEGSHYRHRFSIPNTTRTKELQIIL